MAGKHRKEKIVHAPTKRQVSKWEKQQKMSRIIMLCLGIVVAIVVGLIGWGIYAEQVLPYQKTVVMVNDRSFDFDYYIKTLDAVTQGADQQLVSYYAEMIPQAIQQGEMIRLKAGEAGITFTEDEVQEEIEQGGLPKGDIAASDLAKTRVITRKYTEQVCQPQVPASVQQVEVQAMFLEDKMVAAERREKLVMGDNVTAVASQYSVEQRTRDVRGYLGWVPKDYEEYVMGSLESSLLKDMIFTLEPQEWSEPVLDTTVQKSFGYWVLEVLEKDPAKGTHARGILTPFKEQAENVRAQLLDGGSWEALAKEYSQAAGADSGGDLGWVPVASEGSSMLSRILLVQEQGQISDVIRDESAPTKGGYWLARVMDKQDKPLPDNIIQIVTQECLGTWIDGLMKDVKTEILLDDAQKAQAVLKITRSRSK